MNENVKLFFDEMAVNYVHDDSKLIEELLDSLRVTKCNRILDLGCGKGIISSKLAKRNHGEVVAIDLSSKMIELAKEKIKDPAVTFINADFYQFTDSDKFDAIVCFDAFPHFLYVEGYVNKAYELLKDDGLLAIIHDCGRNELNSHHRAHALKVSRMLDTPQKEFENFKEKFTPLELFENEKEYKMVMIKKES